MYYITRTDPNWSETERLNYLMHEIDLLITSVHEVWPGHFLQALYANKCESPLAKVFGSYSTIEGWAHYSEEMMYGEGLGNYQPEYEMFLRYGAIIRDISFLASIKMHRKECQFKKQNNCSCTKHFLIRSLQKMKL